MTTEYVDSTHTYSITDDNGNKTPLPSVTTILTAAGMYDDRFFTEGARDRGRYIHKALLYLLQDDLVEETVPDEYNGYIAAFKRFMSETDCTPYIEMCEVPLFSDIWRFAGTPDIICKLNGRDVIIDVKTGVEAATTGVQTAAYALLCPIPVVQRFGLYLKADGKYKLVEYKDRNDIKIFNAALSLYHWRQKEGLL